MAVEIAFGLGLLLGFGLALAVRPGGSERVLGELLAGCLDHQNAVVDKVLAASLAGPDAGNRAAFIQKVLHKPLDQPQDHPLAPLSTTTSELGYDFGDIPAEYRADVTRVGILGGPPGLRVAD